MRDLRVTGSYTIGRNSYRNGLYKVTEQSLPFNTVTPEDAERLIAAGKARYEDEGEEE